MLSIYAVCVEGAQVVTHVNGLDAGDAKYATCSRGIEDRARDTSITITNELGVALRADSPRIGRLALPQREDMWVRGYRGTRADVAHFCRWRLPIHRLR
jgi:hypothetical protein